MSKEKIILGWDQVNQDCVSLAKAMQRAAWFGQVKGFIAVSRGGLVPAGILSNLLGVRAVQAVTLVGYDGEQKLDNVEVHDAPDLPNDGEGWVIVDDLSDTGRSLRRLKEEWGNAQIVTLYTKPAGEDMPNISVRSYPQESWLEFPWEYSLDAK